MTTTASGLLCWRDFHPLERQLASLQLLDDLVGEGAQCRRDIQADRLRGLGLMTSSHFVGNAHEMQPEPRWVFGFVDADGGPIDDNRWELCQPNRGDRGGLPAGPPQ